MEKSKARKKVAQAASQKGLKAQFRTKSSGFSDDVRILNASTGKVIAQGTLSMNSSRTGYVDSDVNRVCSQIKQLQAMNSAYAGQTNASSSRRRRKMNCSEDSDTDDLKGDDANFVDDVESIITDPDGNEITVNDMLVVQDPETKEISLFVPTEDDDTVPENVTVIGKVCPADDAAVLDSSRRYKKINASRNVTFDAMTMKEAADELGKFDDEVNDIYSLLSEGEQQLHGKFVGLSPDTDDDYPYIYSINGVPTRCTWFSDNGHLAWCTESEGTPFR